MTELVTEQQVTERKMLPQRACHYRISIKRSVQNDVPARPYRLNPGSLLVAFGGVALSVAFATLAALQHVTLNAFRALLL